MFNVLKLASVITPTNKLYLRYSLFNNDGPASIKWVLKIQSEISETLCAASGLILSANTQLLLSGSCNLLHDAFKHHAFSWCNVGPVSHSADQNHPASIQRNNSTFIRLPSESLKHSKTDLTSEQREETEETDVYWSLYANQLAQACPVS